LNSRLHPLLANHESNHLTIILINITQGIIELA